MDHLIVDRLLKVVADIAGPARTPGTLGLDTLLRDGGLWLDSVALLELIVAVEGEFEVDFDPASDFSDGALESVGSLAAVIGQRLAERA